MPSFKRLPIDPVIDVMGPEHMQEMFQDAPGGSFTLPNGQTLPGTTGYHAPRLQEMPLKGTDPNPGSVFNKKIVVYPGDDPRFIYHNYLHKWKSLVTAVNPGIHLYNFIGFVQNPVGVTYATYVSDTDTGTTFDVVLLEMAVLGTPNVTTTTIPYTHFTFPGYRTFGGNAPELRDVHSRPVQSSLNLDGSVLFILGSGAPLIGNLGYHTYNITWNHDSANDSYNIVISQATRTDLTGSITYVSTGTEEVYNPGTNSGAYHRIKTGYLGVTTTDLVQDDAAPLAYAAGYGGSYRIYRFVVHYAGNSMCYMDQFGVVHTESFNYKTQKRNSSTPSTTVLTIGGTIIHNDPISHSGLFPYGRPEATSNSGGWRGDPKFINWVGGASIIDVTSNLTGASYRIYWALKPGAVHSVKTFAVNGNYPIQLDDVTITIDPNTQDMGFNHDSKPVIYY